MILDLAEMGHIYPLAGKLWYLGYPCLKSCYDSFLPLEDIGNVWVGIWWHVMRNAVENILGFGI